MGKKNIEQMLLSKKIKLSVIQTIWHFSIVPFLLIVPLITIWNIIKYYSGSYEGVRALPELLTGFILIIPTIIFYFIQKNRLRFREFHIDHNVDDFNKALVKTARELQWQFENLEENFTRAHRKWNWTSSWGEMITIIRDDKKILINSICDPDAIFISVISYGWNAKNIKTFISNLSCFTQQEK
jgi:hypothetical protein